MSDPINLGRLAAQLAYVCLREMDAVWDPYAWPPQPCTEAMRRERDRLQSMAARYGYIAHEHGEHGGADDAFGYLAAAYGRTEDDR